MTRISILVLFVLAVFSSCRKDQAPVFEQSIDERLNEALSSYQATLTAAPNGWKGYIYPKGVNVNADAIGGFTFYFKFSNSNRVTMLSDFDDVSSSTPKESSYRLKALQQPALIFDTYNYLHILSDPNPNISRGTIGRGQASDFEYAFDNVTSDTISLTGRFNGVKVTLVRASKQEEDAFNAGRLKVIREATVAYVNSNPFLSLSGTNNARAGVSLDYRLLISKFALMDAGGNLITISAPFSHTVTGLHFKFPVTVQGVTFQDLYWDDVKKVYYILSGTTRIEIMTSTTPVFTIPLTNIIGNQQTTISVPPGAALPGQSPLFLTRYNTAVAGMLSGPYGLTTRNMDFIFNATAKTMLVSVGINQGTRALVAQYTYSYTVDASGFFKFTKTGQDGNGGAVLVNMNNILSFIESDQFSVTGLSSSSALLGQLLSRQNPTFYFSGTLL